MGTSAVSRASSDARTRVAVLGATGFAGAELLRRLLLHPHIEIAHLAAADHVGEPLGSAHPHLEGLSELRFQAFDAQRAVDDVEVVVMGLPPAPSFQVAEAVLERTRAGGRAPRILDMSGAFRLKDPALFERFYGRPHPLPQLCQEFVYGLPELAREQLASAPFVSSPGCFATTITLGLLPLARAGLLHGAVRTVAITGSSGAGKEPTATTHHPVREGNVRSYRALSHPHAPEVESTLRAAGADVVLDFVPLAGPYVRGIFSTSFVELAPGVTREAVEHAFEQAYREAPLVRRPRERLPEVVAVAGSCCAEVGFTWGHDLPGGGSLLTVFSALDNLIKGGAGQAVQNLNLMLGFPETTTLQDPGPYP